MEIKSKPGFQKDLMRPREKLTNIKNKFMKLLFILFLALFSNSAFPQTLKNSEDNFINLTNEIKGDQKTSNDIKNDKTIDKQSDNETKKIESVMIGKLEIPSLGSIGVETSLNKKIGLNLWNNFTANEAIKYLNLLPNKISSRSYQRFLNEVYASTSEPPKGNSDKISKFLEIIFEYFVKGPNVETRKPPRLEVVLKLSNFKVLLRITKIMNSIF